MIAIALILLLFSTQFFAILSFFNSIQSDLRLLGNADLNTIDAMSGREFETYCGILYESIGYKVDVTQQSQDQGADIVLVGHNGRTVIQTKPIMSPIYRRVSL
jgi:HJR/Mrr/RecB family endonuclease